VIAAVVLSVIAGTALALTATALSSEAEEVLAGVLSLVAAGLVTWMIIWLARTARSLAGHLRDDVDRVYAHKAAWGMFFLAFFSVGGEGLETALFVWAAAGSAGQGALPLLGAVLGIAIAVTLGYLIFAGMSRLNLQVFFAWSGALLVVMVAGVLSYEISNPDKIANFVSECFEMGIKVLPPDINKSALKFAPERFETESIHPNAIRYGLSAVKNVGEGAMEAAIAEREKIGPFTSLEDFAARMDSRSVNKRMLEALVKAGAFGFTNETKRNRTRKTGAGFAFETKQKRAQALAPAETKQTETTKKSKIRVGFYLF
jgi:hypothetical protein